MQKNLILYFLQGPWQPRYIRILTLNESFLLLLWWWVFFFKYCTNVSLADIERRSSVWTERRAGRKKKSFLKVFFFFFFLLVLFLELVENNSCTSLCGVLARRHCSAAQNRSPPKFYYLVALIFSPKITWSPTQLCLGPFAVAEKQFKLDGGWLLLIFQTYIRRCSGLCVKLMYIFNSFLTS